MWDDRAGRLMDVLPVGVLVLDDGGVLVKANRPGLEYLGLDVDARGRANFAGLVRDPTLRAALQAPANGVVRLNVTEGDRTLHAELRPDDSESGRQRVLILSDVTAYAKLSLARRKFFYDILHKLRTPLTTILNVLSLTSGGRVDTEKADLAELLGMGVTEADRLATLLGHLKDLYLVETGEIRDEILPETVDVREIVERVIEKLVEQDPPPKHEVQMDLGDEPRYAEVDEEALERAVQMVAENAFAFTPAGGRIHVTVDESGSRVGIRVEDDGIGIAQEELPHVFERFHRGDSRGFRTVEGEGLGLYLARALLAAQGGAILIDSKPGAGTVAEILLKPDEDEV